MIEGLRAEFPGLAHSVERLRLPRISTEPVLWAFVAGVGASFLAHELVTPLVVPLYGAFFPQTVEHPEWLTPATIENGVATVAAGAVLARAGGPGAVVVFVAYQVLTLLLAFPSRLAACEQLGGPIEDRLACDLPTLFTTRWPWAAELVLGSLLARRLTAAAGAGPNRLLRAAGTYALIPAMFFAVAPLVFGRTSPSVVLPGGWITYVSMVAGLYVAAAGLAGWCLARVSFAGTMLIILAVLATAVPQALYALGSYAPPYEPLELLLARWIGALAPIAAVAILVGVRAWARMRAADGVDV